MIPPHFQSGSGANELVELKQRVATLEGLVKELQLFKDEITAKQQKEQQKKQQKKQLKKQLQRIGVLKQHSTIVSNSDDSMEHLVKWRRELGYKLHSRLFRASQNGWSSSDFHHFCDNKGATLVIVKASNGRIFGGFTVNPWQSPSPNGSYVDTNGDKAWLFSLNSATGSIRLNYINPGHVQYNDPSYGPTFGASDLCMYLNPTSHHIFPSSIIEMFNTPCNCSLDLFLSNTQQLYFLDDRERQ